MIRPIAVVVSKSEPLDEQRSRTSGNFSTKWFGSCSSMDVEVTVDGAIDNEVTFSMAIDKGGSDDTIFYNVKNGSRLDYYDSNDFYICNVPLSQRNDFTVKLLPV